ncbi:AAA family ATPase [Acidianus ambivalens]|uniref:AAA family ATPase n=1 Tax=Acidianus ambivalens TaxID=2283 RepID=UPI00128F828B|nr:ATP-binding protein [Acidianus ambivalens]
MGNEIYFGWGKENRVSFSSLLDSLNDWAEDKVILVLDEAQELHKMRGFNILPSLAYAFDNLRKVKIILSGSEIGLLLKFLKLEDAGSPLFGRAFSRVELKPFTKEEAVEFLRRGFEELKVDFSDYEKVYNELGGIPGWLTYFGFRYYEIREFDKAMNETLNYAKRFIISEFEHFLLDKMIAKERYYTIMKSTANCNNWSGIKNELEAKEGIKISDSELSNYLNHLLDSSWLTKVDDRYCPSEPLIGRAFKE